jgi:hypothetical protein
VLKALRSEFDQLDAGAPETDAEITEALGISTNTVAAGTIGK